MKKINFLKRHKLINFFKGIDLIGFRWISHKLPFWIISKPKQQYQIRTIYGFDIIINPLIDKGLERAIYYTGTYEHGTLKLLDLFLKKGDSFMDIGANIGLMSIFASIKVGKHGKVYSFEANPDTQKIFLENLKINNIENTTLYPFAVGSKVDKARIYTNLDLNRGSASLVTKSENSTFHEIDVFPLNTYFNTFPEIKLLKMDIEGFELDALKGMSNIFENKNNNIPILIIECSEKIANTESSKFSVYRFLKKQNIFEFYKLTKGKGNISKLIIINSEKELPTHDNMICIPLESIKIYSEIIQTI